MDSNLENRLKATLLRPNDWKSILLIIFTSILTLFVVAGFYRFEQSNIFSLGLFPVMVASVFGSRWLASITAVFMAVSLDYFFTTPYGYVFDTAASYIRVGYFLGVAVIMVGLVSALRELLRNSEIAKSQLAKTNAELDHTLAVVAHDIRLPAANITGLCEILGSGEIGILPEPIAKHTQMIRSASEQILSLVEDLVSHASFSNGKILIQKMPLNVHAMLSDIVLQNQLNAKKKSISLNFSGTASGLEIMGDKKLLERVFQNLLGNAIKFSFPRGRIDVSAEKVKNKIKISFLDHGPGIIAEELPKIFLPFERLSNKPTAGESSAGLGLSIVKSIIDSHEAEIAVSSQRGLGTCFTLTFYLAPSRERFFIREVTTETKNGFSVLIVDDDDLSRAITYRIVNKLGYKSLEATDGFAAINCVKENDVDCILMDCEMPNMGGIEAAREIRLLRGKGANIPIIGVTGHSSQNIIQQCLDCGMNSVITKPINLDKLKTVINDHLSADFRLQSG